MTIEKQIELFESFMNLDLFNLIKLRKALKRDHKNKNRDVLILLDIAIEGKYKSN